MPELPDVEFFRKRFRGALNRKISGLSVRYSKLMEVSESTLRKRLKGRKLVSTHRRGKHLFVGIDNGYELVLHFGMTGDVSFFSSQEPKHAALILHFSEGRSLAVISVRKLGSIGLTKDRNKFIEEKGLGPDALSMGRKDFTRAMEGCSGSVKACLMDQGRIAGIGNIYSDEILYQAGIRPDRKVGRLSSKDIKKLHSTAMRVLKTAIRNNADSDKMPGTYLLKIGRKPGAKCGICRGTINRIKSGGRSAYFCSRHQK